ncbi:MAG TPA: SPFH domain-containing protein [Candidatus Obscuribacterales bacterium]
MLEICGGILFLSIMVLLSGVKFVREYNRLVVFRLGRVHCSKGPGVQMVLPIIDREVVVDTRIIASPIPTIDCTTADNQKVKLSALCTFQIVDPVRAVLKVDDPIRATIENSQAVLHDVISMHSLQDFILGRGELNCNVKTELSKRTRRWGVRITSVELKEVIVPDRANKMEAHPTTEASAG